MLKSNVPVFICSLALTIALPSAANPASSEPVKPAPIVVSDARLISTMEVSFAMPTRRVRKFVDSYIRDNDESLSSIRDRSQRPFTIIDSVFKQYGLPGELKYLAVIESELRSTALSRVGARGYWQFMPGTARDLGLKVNRRTDERTSMSKSTKAAALYLRDLHNQFKDWLLVLAAYNAGPLPVQRAIARSHSRNFWVLERYLPAESRQHVKRFIATAYYFNTMDSVDPLTPPVSTDNAVCGRSLTPPVSTGIAISVAQQQPQQQAQAQQSFPEFLGTL